MVVIRRIEEPDALLREALVELLLDSVRDGASVGFLWPLEPGMARAYWQDVFAELPAGRMLWVATQRDQVVGTVQLDPCHKPNGRHRAEVQKLLVHSSRRGQRIASRLLAALEAQARTAGLHLLVLDTLLDSTADHVYRHLGWQHCGEIPAYAGAPDGVLHPTVLYCKILGPAH